MPWSIGLSTQDLAFSLPQYTSKDIGIMAYDNAWMDRDLVGYGPDRPDAKWPNGAKIAVNCQSSHLSQLGRGLMTSRSELRRGWGTKL
jgi:hypothetical protein